MLETLRHNRHTASIYLLVLILLGVGLAAVYSSSAVKDANRSQQTIATEYQVPDVGHRSFHSPRMLLRQLMWVGLGLLALFVFYSLDYDAVAKYYLLFLLVAIVLLTVVLIPGIGVKINGARRWLNLGPLRFQPSEFAKLALIIAFSKFLFDNKDRLDNFKKTLLPCIIVVVVFAGLLLVEPDFGMTVITVAICGAVLFMAGIRLRIVTKLAIVGIPLLIILCLLAAYRLERIIGIFDGWQPLHSKIALGSGGFWGVGLGQGLQKYILPAAHNDYIFSMIGEELGMVGALGVLLVYCLLIGLIFWIAYRANDFQGALLASGIGVFIAIPTLINLGVALAVLPSKGLALPFISYGGSAMLVNLAAIGILMNIARDVDRQTAAKAHQRELRRRREKDNLRPTPIWAKN